MKRPQESHRAVHLSSFPPLLWVAVRLLPLTSDEKSVGATQSDIHVCSYAMSWKGGVVAWPFDNKKWWLSHSKNSQPHCKSALHQTKKELVDEMQGLAVAFFWQRPFVECQVDKLKPDMKNVEVDSLFVSYPKAFWCGLLGYTKGRPSNVYVVKPKKFN